MHARGLAVLIAALLLLSCAGQVEDEGCEEMRSVVDGHRNRIEHWGAAPILTPLWRENDVRPVLFKPPYKDPGTGHYCVPQAQSLLLTSSFAGDQTGSNYAFRWRLKVGGGGGSASVLFDMLNTQQIAIAGENINIEAVCEKIDPTGPAFDIGANNIVASVSASVADGNVSSGQATYTQAFSVPAHTIVHMAIPQMATSFRISGNPVGVANPFVAGVAFSFAAGAVSVLYEGTGLSQYSTDFFPLPGTVRDLAIGNQNGVAVYGYIQWGLDL